MSVTLLSSEELAHRLSQRGRALRLAANLRQSDLAPRADVSLATLRRFERGEDIGLHAFLKIVAALGREHEIEGLLAAAKTVLSIAEREARQREDGQLRLRARRTAV